MKTPTVDEMHAMFRAHTQAALNVIVEIMTHGTGEKGEATRLAAAKEVLNRGWGRPTTHKDAPDGEKKPDPWRSTDGKTYEQLYAEEAAKVAARAAAAPPAPAAAAQPSSAAATPASPAAQPASTATPPGRDPDPTGTIARRALWSGPAPQAPRGNGAGPGHR